MLHAIAMSQWTCFQTVNGPKKSSNDVLLPRLRNLNSSPHSISTSCFSFGANALRVIGIGVDQVQTVARNRATETVIGRNLFPYKEVRSSNPVATFVALEGLSRLAIWGRTKTKVRRGWDGITSIPPHQAASAGCPMAIRRSSPCRLGKNRRSARSPIAALLW